MFILPIVPFNSQQVFFLQAGLEIQSRKQRGALLYKIMFSRTPEFDLLTETER